MSLCSKKISGKAAATEGFYRCRWPPLTYKCCLKHMPEFVPNVLLLSTANRWTKQCDTMLVIESAPLLKVTTIYEQKYCNVRGTLCRYTTYRLLYCCYLSSTAKSIWDCAFAFVYNKLTVIGSKARSVRGSWTSCQNTTKRVGYDTSVAREQS